MANAPDVLQHITHSDYWGTSKFDKAHLNSPVTRIHYVAHTNEGDQGDGGLPPTNHWTIFLELGQSLSVRFEVAPNYPATDPGMVVLESKSYAVTNKSSRTISAVPQHAVTVKDILGLIIRLRRDQYKFTVEGEGCRFWCKTFADDLVTAGYLAPAARDNMAHDLALYWKEKGGTVSRPLRAGTFF